MLTESQKKARYKYEKTHLKRIPLDIKKAEYEIIKACAEKAGETVNGYIKAAVRNRINSEKVEGEQE